MIVAGAVIAAVLSGSAKADGYFDTGNDLRSLCRKPDAFSRGACVATVSGAVDMKAALGYKCATAEGATREQYRDVVTKYLAEHPEKRNAAAVFNILLATQEAFGCRPP